MADLNPETRSHTISDVRNGAIPFLPFLEGGERSEGGPGEGGTEGAESREGRYLCPFHNFANRVSKTAALLL